jgi:hypothetical protein
MAIVTVSDQALREMVKEALNGGHLGDMSSLDEEPVVVNPVVDPSASQTDPINPRFVPQTKPELDVAIKQLTKDVPIDQVPQFYKTVRSAIDAENSQIEKDEEMKKAAQGGSKQIEETLRKEVRKILSDMLLSEVGDLPPVKKIPAGVHGGEFSRRIEKTKADLRKSLGRAVDTLEAPPKPEVEDLPDSDGPPGSNDDKRRHSYKSTALGGMSDVAGASFETIAKELDFSVAGAKQAVDKALEKARYLMLNIDDDDREIIILQSMNDYIEMLEKSGELSGSDVRLMKDHPDIVRELDGFREFLSNAIRRMRKADQKVIDPLEEVNSKMTSNCRFCKKTVKLFEASDRGIKYFNNHNGPDGENCVGSRSRVNLGEGKKSRAK